MGLDGAVAAFQLAEQEFGERMQASGVLFDPAIGVEIGLTAALRHLFPNGPPAQAAQVDSSNKAIGPDAYSYRDCAEEAARLTAEPVAQGDAVEMSKMIQRIKAFSGVHLKEGTGATDALYNLAVKHGASEAEAAGFAHSANGEMNELQSCVYNLATIAEQAAQPRAVPDAIVELDECRRRGWNDSAPAYRAGWNDCRNAAINQGQSND